jgi:DNA topoisomerase-1
MSAVAELLTHSCDTDHGIHRIRRGKGFSYVHHNGTPIDDVQALARIKALVIPPAWTDVWICLDRNGHIQATGRDAKGRKQYIYHPEWRAHREQLKFNELVAFGDSLVRLRRRVDADMRSSQLGLERVVATTVWLLDNTLIRVGNDEYVRSGESFGLTTLRDGHIKINGTELRFRFNGKAGKPHDVVIHDRRVANIVRRCRDLPGQRLLQYVDGDEIKSIGSRDVNAYLGLVTSSGFTAKTFRTWGASMIAFGYLRRADPPTSAREYDRQRNQAIRMASEHLHNTPAVCRRSYVHPAIIDDDRELFEKLLARANADKARSSKWMDADERAMLQFLKAADRLKARAAARAA